MTAQGKSVKKGFFSKKKPDESESAPPPAAPVSNSRWEGELEAFEQKVVEEARAKNQIQAVNKELIDPDPNQPRTEFDPEALEELRNSIASNGLLQPLVVRPVGKRYQIIAGERRWRACQSISSLTDLPVVVRNDDDPLTILKLQFAENMHRQNMTPMDVARTYQRVTELVGCSQKRAAEELGVKESLVSITLGLLKAPELVQDLATNGKIRDITTLNLVQRLHGHNPDEARRIVDDIVEGRVEGGSVRKQVNTALQEAKGKPANGRGPSVTRLTAEAVECINLDGMAVLKLRTARGAYEVNLPMSLQTLRQHLDAAEGVVS